MQYSGFRLIPPYARKPRKNNPYYIIRGEIDGKDIERSTKTNDRSIADKIYADFIHGLAHDTKARETKTLRYASDCYIQLHNPSKRELGFIDMLCSFHGDTPVSQITQEDLVGMANTLYPTSKGSTKNRAVLGPAYAILNYSAGKARKWCDYPEMEKFEEDPVQSRKTTIDVARALVGATKSDKRLLILWLFKHSDRITGTLGVEGAHVHMDQDYYDRLTGKKKKKWVKAPLDPEVKNCLIGLYGSKLPQGRIFPWNDRWQVYDWLTPLCASLGVRFTPHVARHSILSWIGDAGGNSFQIKLRAGHASLKSSEPYMAENLKVTRDITAQFVLVEDESIRVKRRGKSSSKARKHA